ncbi:hypothetical protein ACEWY4_018172 [Coilia grayii]|uniref:DUF4371 domain-containing protein n=1 Tax=Coilia grayii TaxID=363190 RepID=A0ABD1JIW0_9TELE
MSKLVTEEIVRQIGDSWYTIKVNGTRDPLGQENISIVLRFVDENYSVCERLLIMATSTKGDAEALTNVIIDELNTARLNTDRILSQVYDGASLMSGRHGATATDADPTTCPSKRKRTVNKTEFKRLFYSVIDAVQGEMNARFGERSSELIGALTSLNPEAEATFLDPLKHRRSMLHGRKAQLIQLAFEKDLTHLFKSEWKDALMRRFSSEKRRLQLF